jgi:hypothetical protein
LDNGISRTVVPRVLAIDAACRGTTADFDGMPDLCVTTRQATFSSLQEQVASEALSGMAQRRYLRFTDVFRRVWKRLRFSWRSRTKD